MDLMMKPGEDIKPHVDDKSVLSLLKATYGLEVSELVHLNAYDDKNYHVLATKSENPFIPELLTEGYVLKIINSLDSRNKDLIEAQNDLLLFLKKKNFPSCKPVKNLNGEFYSLETFPSPCGDSNQHMVRLLEFQPGTLFKNVSGYPGIFFECGVWLGKLDTALEDFHNPFFVNHSTIWHLKSFPLLESFLYVIENSSRHSLVSEVLQSYREKISPVTKTLPQGIIHGDFNEQNILALSSPSGEWHVSGVLDFGDSTHSCYLLEIGTCICYMMVEAQRIGRDPIECGGETLKGYQTQRQLSALECSLLKIAICSRLCQSLVLGLYTQSIQPDNDYISDTQASGWIVLQKLWETPDSDLQKYWAI